MSTQVETFDELFDIPRRAPSIKCHYCGEDLHEDNNAMTRAMDGLEPAARGFGWISVIVEPFNEVPCCDECFDKPETKYLMC
jgi:hypothetical protein